MRTELPLVSFKTEINSTKEGWHFDALLKPYFNQQLVGIVSGSAPGNVTNDLRCAFSMGASLNCGTAQKEF